MQLAGILFLNGLLESLETARNCVHREHDDEGVEEEAEGGVPDDRPAHASGRDHDV